MSAEEAEKELNNYYKRHLSKEYKKGDPDTFKNTKSRLLNAIKHAEKTWEKERERTKEEKLSYTNVHELIKEIGVEVEE